MNSKVYFYLPQRGRETGVFFAVKFPISRGRKTIRFTPHPAGMKLIILLIQWQSLQCFTITELLIDRNNERQKLQFISTREQVLKQ